MRHWIRPPALKLLGILVAVLLIAAAVRWLVPADAARSPEQGPEQGRSTSTAGAAGQPAAQTAQNPAGQSAGSQAGQQKPPVPVLAVAATAKDFPIIIRGLGSVQAFNTVMVKSRVDGQILTVAFQEGQHVHAGDLLMQIDPRPYQAQLAQANANKAKDQANLENAQRDLARIAALVQTQLAATRQQYDT